MTASDCIELIRAPRLTDRAPYAYAAVASDVRRLVFTAGACPLDEEGETVAVGNVAGQAEQVMANLRTRWRRLVPTSQMWSRQPSTWPATAGTTS
jgi:enamine deaminase RidA (YjgF/YER057c/UK114 family)